MKTEQHELHILKVTQTPQFLTIKTFVPFRNNFSKKITSAK